MNAGEIVLALFNARTSAHIAHLTTKSYAAHKALGEFYEGVVDLADRYAEVAMGLTRPMTFKASTFKLESDQVKMLNALLTMLDKARKEEGHPSLQQILDDTVELVAQTIFLLNLK